jgi:hypothetical protein
VSLFTELCEVRDDLDLILTDVLSSVLAEEAIPTHCQLPLGPLAVARLAIHDQLDNGYAIVEVRTSVSLARVIAARMMAVASPLPDDIVDAVAELGNIAGGNVKTLLCHHARLSLPNSEITEQAPYAEPEPESGEGAAYVRAMVLGHVAQLAVQPDAAIDGLYWPPFTPDEIPERSL